VPRRLLGRDVFSWAWPLMSRATLDTRFGCALRTHVAPGGDWRIGIPERSLAEAGVARVGRVTEQRGGLPVCGGAALQPRVVVWCTGFEPDYGWIALPVTDERGVPRHVRGVATDRPGLYFVGLQFQHRMTSSLVGGVGQDAEYIALHVSSRHDPTMVA
jgi:putative flavoprotein involved in K+ transport